MADERIKKNSFKQLMEEEYEPRFTLPQMTEIENRIQRHHHSCRLAGDVLDLFFPKVLKTVAGMLGADDDDNRNRTAPPDVGGTGASSQPKGPGGR